jgi:hypothetical protein
VAGSFTEALLGDQAGPTAAHEGAVGPGSVSLFSAMSEKIALMKVIEGCMRFSSLCVRRV